MATNIYGNGTSTATAGANTVLHYYDKAGVKAANEESIYAQWADRRSMPLKMGKTYKVSKWLHIYDNLLDPLNQHGGTSAEFDKKGYLTGRSIVGVSTDLASKVALAEGAGAVNKVSIKKVTIEQSFSRYGQMLDYTDEVEMFSEDIVQVQYREELGYLANRQAEDLIQLDMLTTTTVMYSGTATSLLTVGADTTSPIGADDGDSVVTYDLVRKGVRKLVRNRAVKNTSIVTGSTKVNTRVINKAFYAIIGPEIKYDLESVVKGTVSVNGQTEYAYIPAYKYADAANLAEGEVGAMNDLRFIESESALSYKGAGAVVPTNYSGDLARTTHDNVSAGALNVFTGGNAYAGGEVRFDVFPILVPTKGSFATIGLKGHGKIKFNSQAPQKIELGNPYGNQGFFSYNMWYAGIILRDERLLKLLVAASE